MITQHKGTTLLTRQPKLDKTATLVKPGLKVTVSWLTRERGRGRRGNECGTSDTSFVFAAIEHFDSLSWYTTPFISQLFYPYTTLYHTNIYHIPSELSPIHARATYWWESGWIKGETDSDTGLHTSVATRVNCRFALASPPRHTTPFTLKYHIHLTSYLVLHLYLGVVGHSPHSHQRHHLFVMDIDSSPPPQSAAEPIDSSTPPTDLPPSPPDTNTISDIRGTVMDGDAEEREESLPIGLDISMDMDRVGSSSSHASAAGTGNGTGGKNDTTASDPTPIPSTPVTVSTPQPHKSKISLRFRQPALNADLTGGESSGPSRASTPGSGTGTGGRKRKR